MFGFYCLHTNDDLEVTEGVTLDTSLAWQYIVFFMKVYRYENITLSEAWTTTKYPLHLGKSP